MKIKLDYGKVFVDLTIYQTDYTMITFGLGWWKAHFDYFQIKHFLITWDKLYYDGEHWYFRCGPFFICRSY